MKLEPNTFYLLANGDLMKTWMEDGLGRMIGAIYDESDEDEPYWDCYCWGMSGRFGTTIQRHGSTLDAVEKIDARPSMVSYHTNTDYCASYDNDEPNDDGNMSQGFGATEFEAVMDLLQNYPGPERAERMTRSAA